MGVGRGIFKKNGEGKVENRKAGQKHYGPQPAEGKSFSKWDLVVAEGCGRETQREKKMGR